MILRIFFLFSFVAAALWCPSVYKRTVHPFRTGKFLICLPYKKEWETRCDREEDIRAILQQNFSYFAKGQQSYVFLSEDGRHVLKLFLFDSCKTPFGQKLLHRYRKWKNPFVRNELPAHLKAKKTFDSCKLAYDLAPDWTGLIYVHLNPEKVHLPFLRLKDKIGIVHRLDPSRFRFVLQKRAVPFTKILRTSEKKEDLIASFHRLIDRFEELGLANFDPVLGRNFAFLDGEAVAIDVGNFYYNPQKAKESKENFLFRFERFQKDRL